MIKKHIVLGILFGALSLVNGAMAMELSDQKYSTIEPKNIIGIDPSDKSMYEYAKDSKGNKCLWKLHPINSPNDAKVKINVSVFEGRYYESRWESYVDGSGNYTKDIAIKELNYEGGSFWDKNHNKFEFDREYGCMVEVSLEGGGDSGFWYNHGPAIQEHGIRILKIVGFSGAAAGITAFAVKQYNTLTGKKKNQKYSVKKAAMIAGGFVGVLSLYKYYIAPNYKAQGA